MARHLILADGLRRAKLADGQGGPYIPPDFYPNDIPAESAGFPINAGQVVFTNGDPATDVAYYSEGLFPQVFVQNGSKMSFVIATADTSAGTEDTLRRVDMTLTGELASWKDHVAAVAHGRLQNFYLDHCGSGGVEDVPSYERVIYEDVYPYIDMHVYTGSMGQKMAFVVRPGGDPENLLLEFEGQDDLDVDVSGALRMWFGTQYISIPEAVAYQVNTGGTIVPLAWDAEYTANSGTGLVNFTFDNYNPAKVLVLQVGPAPLGGGPFDVPGICWSTYFGGNGRDFIHESITDPLGNYYVAGQTSSSFLSFPPSPGYSLFAAGECAFVCQLDDTDNMVWKSFIGGNVSGEVSQAGGLGVRGGTVPSIYMAGTTTSQSFFPQASGTAYFVGTNNYAGNKGYISRFDISNGQVMWSTYFGDADVQISGLAIPDNDYLFVTGRTYGSLPIEQDPGSGVSYSYSGNGDGFVCRLNTDDRTTWCTFFAGNEEDRPLELRATKDPTPRVVIAGRTTSASIQLEDPGIPAYVQSAFGGQDAFIYEFDFAGAHVWSTHVGGPVSDIMGQNALALEPGSGDVVIGGFTSGQLNIVPGPGWSQSTFPSLSNPGFMARFSGANRSIQWLTYVAGAQFVTNDINSVVFDAFGRLFVSGRCSGPGLVLQPYLTGYFQPVIVDDHLGGSTEQSDCFLMGFDAGQQLLWSTYFGGDASAAYHELIYTMLPRYGNLYVAGFTSKQIGFFATYFPLDDGGGVPYFEPGWQGAEYEGFVTSFCLPAPVSLEEIADAATELSAYCSAPGTIQLEGVLGSSAFAELIDSRGRTLCTDRLSIQHGRASLAIPAVANGIYLLHVPGQGSVKIHLQ